LFGHNRLCSLPMGPIRCLYAEEKEPVNKLTAQFQLVRLRDKDCGAA